ncbi:MAG: hypothetical protein RR949_01115 [Oscillospiraceae bacterium]
MSTLEQVKLIPGEIPKMEVRLLASTVLEAVERFYKDPVHEQAFQTWLAKRQVAV